MFSIITSVCFIIQYYFAVFTNTNLKIKCILKAYYQGREAVCPKYSSIALLYGNADLQSKVAASSTVLRGLK